MGDSIALAGVVTADMQASGRMSDIERERYEAIAASGRLTVEGVTAALAGLPEVKVRRAAMSVSPAALTLSELGVTVGRSDIEASGTLSNYIGYLLRDQTLRGRLDGRSSLLDLNELLGDASEASADTGAAAAPADTAAMRAVVVPQNLDLALGASLKKILFQKMVLDDFTGSLTVAKGTVSMNRLAMNAFGGRMSASGSYSTAADAQRPALKLKAEIADASFSTTFDQLDVVRRMVPLFEKTGGDYSMSLDLATRLTQTMNPDYATLQADGAIRSKNIRVQNIAVFDQLAAALKNDALRRIEVVADDALHRYGDLSPRGVREHRGIAERMYCSFPEIFSTSDGRLCRIRARSTLVPRCMLSVAAANERLKDLNPAIDITREASKRYLDYMFCMTEANKIKKEIKQRIAELREREIDPSRFVRALVTDPSLVGNRKEQLRFMNDLYCVASVMQDVDYLDCSFYDLFTPDELYAFYAVRNYQMYLEEGPSAEFGHRALSDAVPLLRNFVAEADEAIATGALSASLRYGHDVNVIPLVGLMGIEGCDTRESDYRKVDQAWSCWRVTPMATNIQLVFFRRPDGGDVLVKFLFNERESRIRLESDLAPYYRWNDVKRYFDERIATQTRR